MTSVVQVHIKDVRLSYPSLFNPGDKPNSRGEYKYKGTFLFDPGSEADKLCQAAIIKAASEEYGPNWKAILQAMEPSKKCLRKGENALDKAGNVRSGYAGKMYLSASNIMKPKVVGGRRGPDGKFAELDPQGGKPFGGCYVNAIIDISAMKAFGDAPNNVFGKLIAVQFLRDGKAFGSGPTSAEGFDEVEGAEEDFSGGAAATADNLFD